MTQNKGHNTRSKDPKCDRQLRICRDQNEYQGVTEENEQEGDENMKVYQDLREKLINIPEIKRGKDENAITRPCATRSPGSSEATSVGTAGIPEEMKKLLEAVPLKVPDLFQNVRLREPEKFVEYKKLKPEGQPEIPDSYVKHIEPVYLEEQNTVEKNWSFTIKDYEVTEEKIAQCKNLGIQISPSDFEWVVDIWEKTAINDNQ